MTNFSPDSPYVETEKEKQPVITAYVIRHGEAAQSKALADNLNPHRSLTPHGREQIKNAANTIVDEIVRDTDPHTPIELRGYDSGTERSNEALIIAARVLIEHGYSVTIPVAAEATAQNSGNVDLSDIKDKGLKTHGGSGIRERIRPILFPAEAQKTLMQDAEQQGEGLLVKLLTTPPEQLEAMGVETPIAAARRMHEGIKKTNAVAQRLKARNYPNKIVAIAISHDYVMAMYLAQQLGIDPKQLREIENAEGLRIDFTGNPGEQPNIQFWGEHLQGRMKGFAPKNKNDS